MGEPRGETTAASPVGDGGAEWIVNRPSGGGRALDLRELWTARDIVWFLALRDIRARYKQAFFGIAWAVLQPLATVVVFTFVFREVAGIDTGETPYVVFALAGTLVWSYFASSLAAAIEAMVGNAELVTKVYFPRLLAPVAALVPALVGLGVGLVVLAVALLVYDMPPGPSVAAVVPAVALAMVAALGPGLILATLNVRFRDVAATQALLIQLWLFASPVGYPLELVSEDWRLLYSVNPVVAPIELMRWAVTGDALQAGPVAVSVASALVLVAVGLLVFHRAERRFADVI